MFKKKHTRALVVPTIRENCLLDFLERWAGIEDVVDIHVIEDNPKRTFEIAGNLEWGSPENFFHYCWEDIENDLKEKSWIIPRRSDTVRSYAYWKCWSMGYKFIMTLDDDCYPPLGHEDGVAYDKPETFVNEHLKALLGKTKWFNTLNSVKPRGVPFYNLGNREDIIVNHGLWTKVLDYDAPTQLVQPTPEKFSFDNKIVPHGSFFPMCGMNVMWRAEYTVLMYHLLMGKMFDSSAMSSGLELHSIPFDRFGDIWCGILMKKCADMLGKSVSTGMPYIRHERASNPFTNLKKEANGLEVNENFWEYVDKFKLTKSSLSPHNVYHQLGDYIGRYEEFPEYVDYFVSLGHAMKEWADLFNA